MAREKLDEHFWALRKVRRQEVVENSGVTKDRIRLVLGVVGKSENPDIIDAVFALLDDKLPSQFARLTQTHLFTGRRLRTLGVTSGFSSGERENSTARGGTFG